MRLPDGQDGQPEPVAGSGGAGLSLAPSDDPREMAGQILDITVSRLADAAGVFVLDRLPVNGPLSGTGDGDVIVRRLGTRFTGGSGDGASVPHEVLPAWGVVTFAAGSPYARCLRGGHPVAFEQTGTRTAARTGSDDVLARYLSFLAVPIIAEGTPNGLITLARTSGRPAFDKGEIAAASELATQAAVCLTSARRVVEQQAAEARQHGLPPAGLVTPDRLEVAGRCLPATGTAVGGDWYDVVALPRGRTGLIVGDVMGHGPVAAAVMVELSAAAHALACADLQPAELLAELDRTAITLGDIVYATCAYAVIDPADAAATIALAGHLPPVLAMPDGTTHVLELPSGLSLGLGIATFGQVRIRLLPGTVLALFTDGLVETRTQPFDQGIRVLQSILAREHGALDDACDTILRSLASHPEDDTTILLARIPASGR
ncbi:MAG TPA: GAF domain-containing SpoIIE family protein phosphatase [Streptosporangiaceae bacterium]|nr:GAF domain-containing SpoIIE family protein phosphatase [Streptosporangiaceae bacterium]